MQCIIIKPIRVFFCFFAQFMRVSFNWDIKIENKILILTIATHDRASQCDFWLLVSLLLHMNYNNYNILFTHVIIIIIREETFETAALIH